MPLIEVCQQFQETPDPSAVQVVLQGVSDATVTDATLVDAAYVANLASKAKFLNQFSN